MLLRARRQSGSEDTAARESDSYGLVVKEEKVFARDTLNTRAQCWFDRGINWIAGFHREEAAHCFAKAIEADRCCPMAHWGLALADGPDYKQLRGFQLAAKESGYPFPASGLTQFNARSPC